MVTYLYFTDPHVYTPVIATNVEKEMLVLYPELLTLWERCLALFDCGGEKKGVW